MAEPEREKYSYNILQPFEQKKLMQQFRQRCQPLMKIINLPTVIESIIIEYALPRIAFSIHYTNRDGQPTTLYVTDN